MPPEEAGLAQPTKSSVLGGHPSCEGREVPLRDSGQQARGSPKAGGLGSQCAHLLQPR